MKRTIGILAHVDAGKTTFSEQVLYHAQSIRTRGRVDHQNAFLDADPIERRRGVTIFSDQAEFTWKDLSFDWIDTPGHADFSAEMERAVQVMDCAVVLVSCVEGVQGHTETVWQLLRRHHIPTLFFLNKTDRAGADPGAVLEELKQLTDTPDALINLDFFTQDSSLVTDETLEPLEQLAMLDEELLERYLNGAPLEKGFIADRLRVLFAGGRVLPYLQGSALQDRGVTAFLDLLALLAGPPCNKSLAPATIWGKYQGQERNPFRARVYRIRHDDQRACITFLKVLSGTLLPRQELAWDFGTDAEQKQKVNELRVYNGEKYRHLDKAQPGDLCAVTGLSGLRPGDGVGPGIESAVYETAPALWARVEYDAGCVNTQEALARLRLLEQEDPLLGVRWEESLGQISLRVMGVFQLEILRELVKARFDWDISFGPCQVLYRETIAQPVVGCGHFEPLRHYAEVHLRISPGPRGSGIRFESACPTDELAESWQRLIATHVLEREHKGVALGAPLTDVVITLLAGRAHEKHTQGGDFREAVYRAIRQGLMQAQTVVLEPWYALYAQTTPALAGRVMADIRARGGEYQLPISTGSHTVVRGRAPVAALLDYAKEFASFSGGKGSLRLVFDGYEPCRNQQAVIDAQGYQPERDIPNTPDSVFCAKGAGFVVKWEEAPGYMHCHYKKR